MGSEGGLRGLLEADRVGGMEGKPEAPERGGSGRAMRALVCVHRTYGDGLDLMGSRDDGLQLSIGCLIQKYNSA